MAINASMVWRIRAGGSNNNGAGYDAAVASAGTDYSDQDTAQLALTDIVADGTTTLTSVTGGFTSAMIGNVIKLRSFSASGQTGYRVITAHTDTNTITVDSTVTAGTGGSGNVGGASATILNYANGGTLGTPAVTSPLAAGHTVYIRGAGTDDPSSADYTHTGGHAQYAAGNTTSGLIRFIGYNGRPRFNCDALFAYNMSGTYWENFKFVAQNTTNGTNGILNDASATCATYNCRFDQNSNDIVGCRMSSIVACHFLNSGATQTSGTGGYAIQQAGGSYPNTSFGNFINGWRGGGILADTFSQRIAFNVIANIKSSSKFGVEITQGNYACALEFNTIYNCASDGVRVSVAAAIKMLALHGNIIANNGGYGVNFFVGSTALNDRTKFSKLDYNDYYSNTSGARNNFSAGANDSTLDPTFTNASGGDFSIGTNLKALGYPGAFPGGTSTGYLDMGAVQRQEAGGGGSAGIFFAVRP